MCPRWFPQEPEWAGLGEYHPDMHQLCQSVASPLVLGDPVSQNLQLWVGVDTQLWIIFHSYFLFLE